VLQTTTNPSGCLPRYTPSSRNPRVLSVANRGSLTGLWHPAFPRSVVLGVSAFNLGPVKARPALPGRATEEPAGCLDSIRCEWLFVAIGISAGQTTWHLARAEDW
jgi:hypothetical protein